MKSTNLQKIYLKDGIGRDDFLRGAKKMLKALENIITYEFLTAVNKCDGHKIIEIAEAVWFLKSSLKGELGDNFKDLNLARLILIKAQLKRAGEKWTVRQAAEYVHGRSDVTKTQIDSIREKCRQIGFPIKPERPIRKK